MAEVVGGWRYRKVTLSPEDAKVVADEIADQLRDQTKKGVTLFVLSPALSVEAAAAAALETDDDGTPVPLPACPSIAKPGIPIPPGCPAPPDDEL